MNEMDFILYGGVVVTGLIVGFGYRLIRRRGKSEPAGRTLGAGGSKNDAMNKISEFYASQNNDLNY